MNIQQLQYIVAVDEEKHFQRAAEHCHITPATLSQMVKKLEEELGVILFDRSKQPVKTTDEGRVLVDKARIILMYVKDFEQTARSSGDEISGEVRIGIIPTLSPYLSHLFLPSLLQKFPQLRIKLHEWNTTQIVEGLVHDKIDVGIAATPTHAADVHEKPLFYEELLVYTAAPGGEGEYVVPESIDLRKLWLLEEEHCLRSQVSKLCSLKKKYDAPLEFEAGSIATLLNMVKVNQGLTVIPELVVNSLSAEQQKGIRHFVAPVPVREISLITYRQFLKAPILKVLEEEIVLAVSQILKDNKGEKRVVSL